MFLCAESAITMQSCWSNANTQRHVSLSVTYTVLAALALSVQTLNFVLVTIVNHDSCSLMVTTQMFAYFSLTVILSTIVFACASSFAKVVVFLAMLSAML